MTTLRDGHPWDEAGFTYESNVSPADLAGVFAAASSVLITTHEKPDGDALGTSLALHRSLRQIGVRSWIVLAGPLDQNLLAVTNEDDDVRRFEECGTPSEEEEPDLIAVVDTGAWTQLDSMKDWLRPRVDRVVGVDHHARGGSVAGRRVVDTECA